MSDEIRVTVDADLMVIDDLKALESGTGLHGLITRVVTRVEIDGVEYESGKVPLKHLKAIAKAIGTAIEGLSNPNA